MQMLIKLVVFTCVAIFAFGVWYLAGTIVSGYLPEKYANVWAIQFAISGAVGAFPAAAVASPFLVILFARRRWLAALFAAVPIIILYWPSNSSFVGVYLAGLYFMLLLAGVWLTARLLESD